VNLTAGSALWWQSARGELATSRDWPDLHARLKVVARSAFPVVRSLGVEPDDWKALGIQVREGALDGLMGASTEHEGRRCVVVARTDRTFRRRFTILHEIAHLLLRDFHQVQPFPLDYAAEERLCDAFAAEASMPRWVAERTVEQVAPSAAVVLDISKQFSVSLAVTLSQLTRWFEYHDKLAFVARFSRQDERRLQAYKSVVGDYFLGQNQTVSKLGLGEIEEWAATAQSGEVRRGRAETVELNLWRPSRGTSQRSGKCYGPAEWEAERLRNGLILVLVDVAHMSHHWYRRRDTAAA
jgi:Zn-dependent peptidase ImmA (M78 family)